MRLLTPGSGVSEHVSRARPAKSGARELTEASRLVSGARPYRASIVARIEVVSVGSELTRGPRSSGEITSAGIRVPGPHWSETPARVGGGTWSHCPPNSS